MENEIKMNADLRKEFEKETGYHSATEINYYNYKYSMWLESKLIALSTPKEQGGITAEEDVTGFAPYFSSLKQLVSPKDVEAEVKEKDSVWNVACEEQIDRCQDRLQGLISSNTPIDKLVYELKNCSRPAIWGVGIQDKINKFSVSHLPSPSSEAKEDGFFITDSELKNLFVVAVACDNYEEFLRAYPPHNWKSSEAKDISEITEEDLIGLAKILRQDAFDVYLHKEPLGNYFIRMSFYHLDEEQNMEIEIDEFMPVIVYQYLQSKNYELNKYY